MTMQMLTATPNIGTGIGIGIGQGGVSGAGPAGEPLQPIANITTTQH
jgi:hypothetical protein